MADLRDVTIGDYEVINLAFTNGGSAVSLAGKTLSFVGRKDKTTGSVVVSKTNAQIPRTNEAGGLAKLEFGVGGANDFGGMTQGKIFCSVRLTDAQSRTETMTFEFGVKSAP